MSLESLYLLFDECILLKIEESFLIVLIDEDGDNFIVSVIMVLTRDKVRILRSYGPHPLSAIAFLFLFHAILINSIKSLLSIVSFKQYECFKFNNLCFASIIAIYKEPFCIYYYPFSNKQYRKEHQDRYTISL